MPSRHASGLALLPTLLETPRPAFIGPFFCLQHLRIPLLFLGRKEGMELVLLPSGEIDGRRLSLRYGFSDEHVFNTGA